MRLRVTVTNLLVDRNFTFPSVCRIKRLENFELDESVWEDDEETLLMDYETELDEMSNEDYEDMLDDMGDFPLEYRIGLLFLHGADVDDDMSEIAKSKIS